MVKPLDLKLLLAISYWLLAFSYHQLSVTITNHPLTIMNHHLVVSINGALPTIWWFVREHPIYKWHIICYSMGVSINGVPQNGWFIRENPTNMDDLGVPLL